MKKDTEQQPEASHSQAPILTVRVPEACRITGISRSKLYQLIKNGRLKIIKVGGITLIAVTELRQLLGIQDS